MAVEHKLNSIVEVNGTKYSVEPGNTCNACAFDNENIAERCKVCADFHCSMFNRSDKTDIVYKKVD